MTHRITSVKPMDNFILLVEFLNGTQKTYDVKSLYSVFSQFKVFETNQSLFSCVTVDAGGYGISWNDDLDLDAEDIWEDGIEVGILFLEDAAKRAEISTAQLSYYFLQKTTPS